VASIDAICDGGGPKPDAACAATKNLIDCQKQQCDWDGKKCNGGVKCWPSRNLTLFGVATCSVRCCCRCSGCRCSASC